MLASNLFISLSVLLTQCVVNCQDAEPRAKQSVDSYLRSSQGSSSLDIRALFGRQASCGAGESACTNQPDYCCQAGRDCCPNSDNCVQPGGECCPVHGTCEPGWHCCGDMTCYPEGGQCCDDGLYCRAGYYCTEDGCRKKSGGGDGDDDDDDDDVTVTKTTTRSTTRDVTSTYRTTITWYYWSYSYSILLTTYSLTSIRHTETTTLTVYATHVADAREKFESITETMSFPTPAEATTTPSLPSLPGSSPTSDSDADAGRDAPGTGTAGRIAPPGSGDFVTGAAVAVVALVPAFLALVL